MEGDSLTLECACSGMWNNHSPFNTRIALIVGADDLELTWLRNSKEIPDNPDFRREHDGNAFKLVVAEV